MRSKLWSPAVWPVMGSIVLAISLSLSAANVPIELGVQGRGNATPTLAADGQFVAVAWGGTQPSGATDVFAAVSRDGGRAFAPPVRVDRVDGDARLNGEQPPMGPDAALTVAWDEAASGSRRIAVARSQADDGGHPRFRREALTTSGPAIYPALAVAGDGVVVAWTNGASAAPVIQVARIAGSKAAGTDR